MTERSVKVTHSLLNKVLQGHPETSVLDAGRSLKPRRPDARTLHRYTQARCMRRWDRPAPCTPRNCCPRRLALGASQPRSRRLQSPASLRRPRPLRTLLAARRRRSQSPPSACSRPREPRHRPARVWGKRERAEKERLSGPGPMCSADVPGRLMGEKLGRYWIAGWGEKLVGECMF